MEEKSMILVLRSTKRMHSHSRYEWAVAIATREEPHCHRVADTMIIFNRIKLVELKLFSMEIYY